MWSASLLFKDIVKQGIQGVPFVKEANIYKEIRAAKRFVFFYITINITWYAN